MRHCAGAETPNAMKLVSAADVATAAANIAGRIRHTELAESPALSDLSGARVFLKLENRQLTGSFKDRGAYNALLSLAPKGRSNGVIAMSAGNHAQAVAAVAKTLGIPATIVMPATTPFLKVRRTRSYGADVVLHGDTLAEAAERAGTIAAEKSLTFVHPYDDAAVIAGQGTVGLEIVEQAPGPIDAVIVPVGGGGLLSGVLTAVKARSPATQVIGVETEAYPSLARILHGGTFSQSSQNTIAEGIAVKSIGDLPLKIVRDKLDDALTVPDVEIERAIHLYLENEKLVVEGAGAASLALLLAHRERFRGKNVALIVSGGNIDTGLLASVIARVRVGEHRVHRMRVEISDQPGVLARVAAIVGSVGANILDVEHQRQSSAISAKSAYLAIAFETPRPQDADEVLRRLSAAGFLATLSPEA